ncbi:sensor histidine kinase [Marinactinospora rubrisoli]|uniref:histidine kinase n=1 Tax=Marinactinospora rubrisoli TaxID=2715399 RepID=A0ABW2KB17_9ACTN
MTDSGRGSRTAGRWTARMRAVATRAVLTDALIVVAVAGINAAMISGRIHGPESEWPWGDDLAGQLAGIGLSLLLFARRRFPTTVFVLLSLCGLAADHAGVFVQPVASLGAVAAVHAAGRHLPLRRSLVGLGCGTVVNIAVSLASPFFEIQMTVWNIAFYLSWIFGGWWLGRLARLRAAHLAELQARAARLEHARDAHARAVLAEERSRIARELHDVVAHHVSVMTVQATAGRRVIDRSPERARQALEDIEETGRQAMSEMRRIVGVLRTSGSGATGRGPQPGLADLPDLLGQVRETGVSVTLHTQGAARPLPPGLELTVYRVVQESLTNVLKHAGPDATAAITLRFEPGAVSVGVEDDGAGPAATDRGGDEPGHGLLGMRERVSLFGGDLEVGPRPGGGFAVHARIPENRSGGPDRSAVSAVGADAVAGRPAHGRGPEDERA